MKKLNASGISHLIIPIVVVVAVAAVGTFMLVASHADSPNSISKHGTIKIESRVEDGHVKEHTEYWAKVSGPEAPVQIGGKFSRYQGNNWYAINVTGTHKSSERMKVIVSYDCRADGASGSLICKHKSRVVKFEH